MSAQAGRASPPDPVSHEVKVVLGHDVGGAVGDLHRMVEERLAATPEPVVIAVPADEKLIRVFSRLTGYALLAGGFAAAAWFLF